MAEDGFKTLVISFILVGLFIYALIAFGIQFQTDMDANQTILNETTSNLNTTYGSLKTNLTGAEDTGKSSREKFEDQAPITSTSGEVSFTSIVAAGKNFAGTMTGFFKTIFGLLKVTLGFDDTDDTAFTIVLSTLGAIFLVTVIFFAWRAYRAGS